MRTRIFLGLASILVTLGVGLPACSNAGDNTNIESDFCSGVGNASKSESGKSGLEGSCSVCNAKAPIAVGGTETLFVSYTIKNEYDSEDSEAQPSFTVESSDPTRLLVVSQRPVCTGSTSVVSIDVNALAAGDVKVLVKDADGEQVDSIDVELREAATMNVEYYDPDRGPVTAEVPFQAQVGESFILMTSLLSAFGEPLYANESITWTVSNLKVVGFGQGLPEAGQTTAHRSVMGFYAATAGTAELTVEHVGLKQTITINVN